MITEDEFLAIAKAKPDMMRAFQKAVNAAIDFRTESATNSSGLWAKARLKKKAFTALFLANQFTRGFILNGKSALEEDKNHIRGWIIGGADFKMSSKE
jgi:hypothetical protein